MFTMPQFVLKPEPGYVANTDDDCVEINDALDLLRNIPSDDRHVRAFALSSVCLQTLSMSVIFVLCKQISKYINGFQKHAICRPIM